MDDEGAVVIDHLSYDVRLDNGDHTTIVANPVTQLADIPPILGGPDSSAKEFSPILFKGIGYVLITFHMQNRFLTILGLLNADST